MVEAGGWSTMKHRMVGFPLQIVIPCGIEAQRVGEVQCRSKAVVLAAHNLLAQA